MENTEIIRTESTEIERREASLVDQWHDSLALDVRAGSMAQATAETYKRGLAKFVTWGQANPEHVTDHAVKSWLASLRDAGISQNAIAVWFAGVRAFFQWAVSEKHIASDPTQGIKRGKRAGTAKTHKREMLSDDEMMRVLNGDLSKRDRALVHLLAYTATRGIELQRADIEDLRTEGHDLVLYVQGKGELEKNQKVVIAHPSAVTAIYDYLGERKASRGALFISGSNRNAGGRISSRALRGIVRGILDNAGVTSRNKTVHSFRHSAITSAIRNGATLQDAQAMARHANVATTQVYFHHLDRMKNAAERRIGYGG